MMIASTARPLGPFQPRPLCKPVQTGTRGSIKTSLLILPLGWSLGAVRKFPRLSRRAGLDGVDEAIASLLKQRAVVRKSERVPVRSLRLGQKLTGIIRDIGPCGIFLDVGAQRDGLVPISLVSAGYVADVYEEYMPGQKVTVWVAQIKHNGELSLTMQPKRERKRRGMLNEDLSVFRDHQDWLTGTLLHISEKGLFVEVPSPNPEQGPATGFVPLSEASGLRSLKVGMELKVRVLPTKGPSARNANKLYLSMRSPGRRLNVKPPAEAENVEDDLDVFLQIPKATWLRGVVKRTTSSGAFLSLRHPFLEKRATSFVHISKMATEKIEDPAQVVEVGEEVSVRLLELNETGQLEASMIA